MQQHLGNVSARRIRLTPSPGHATESDLLAVHAREDRLFELIDGTLVEKCTGWYESMIAVAIVREMSGFVNRHNLGRVLGADAELRILERQVRLPDVCYVRWERFQQAKPVRGKIPSLVPDLAVEVLSEGNTPEEMERKLAEYFQGGVRLVWYIDPAHRNAVVHTAVDRSVTIGEDGVLDGGDVLPNFQLSLAALFAEAEQQGPADGVTADGSESSSPS